MMLHACKEWVEYIHPWSQITEWKFSVMFTPQRFSHKSIKVYITMLTGIMARSSFSTVQCFGKKKWEAMNTCVCAVASWALIKQLLTIISINTLWYCYICFYVFKGQPFWKQLYLLVNMITVLSVKWLYMYMYGKQCTHKFTQISRN